MIICFAADQIKIDVEVATYGEPHGLSIRAQLAARMARAAIARRHVATASYSGSGLATSPPAMIGNDLAPSTAPRYWDILESAKHHGSPT